jgi:hypothetical protein
LEEEVAEIVLRIRIIRIRSQRRFVFGDCFVHPAELNPDGAEVIVPFREAWLDPHGLFELRDRVQIPAGLKKRIAEIVVGLDGIGFDRQGRFILGNRLRQPAFLEQRDPEVAARRPIAACAPQTINIRAAARLRYLRCSALVCVATGRVLELGARRRQTPAPRNPRTGRRQSAITGPVPGTARISAYGATSAGFRTSSVP